jgi:hypothetical protein
MVDGECTARPPSEARKRRSAHDPGSLSTVADELDVEAMIERFRERAKAVRNRPLPPVAGPDKKRFLERAQIDYMDFAMLGDATGTLEDGILTLRIDLRPPDAGQ